MDIKLDEEDINNATYEELMCRKLKQRLNDLNEFKHNFFAITRKHFKEVPVIIKRSKTISGEAYRNFKRINSAHTKEPHFTQHLKNSSPASRPNTSTLNKRLSKTLKIDKINRTTRDDIGFYLTPKNPWKKQKLSLSSAPKNHICHRANFRIQYRRQSNTIAQELKKQLPKIIEIGCRQVLNE